MGQAKARKVEIDAIKALRETEFNMGIAQGMSVNDQKMKGSAEYYAQLFADPDVKKLGLFCTTDLVQQYFGAKNAEDGAIACLLNHLEVAREKFKEPIGQQIISESTIRDDKTGVLQKVYVVTENYRTMTTVCLKADIADYRYAN